MMQSTCTFDGCGKPHYGRGLCDGHYRQQRKGQELRPLRPKLTLEQRFWRKVTKTDDCWVWTAATGGDGYGLIRADGCMRLAHRVSWELTNESIPDNMHIDHRCGNRACVNSAHLRTATNAQNSQHRTGNQRNNTSGVRGVSWNKWHGAWQAQVRLDGRRYHGGYHSTLEAADQAARALRARLFTHDDHDQWLNNKEKAS